MLGLQMATAKAPPAKPRQFRAFWDKVRRGAYLALPRTPWRMLKECHRGVWNCRPLPLTIQPPDRLGEPRKALPPHRAAEPGRLPELGDRTGRASPPKVRGLPLKQRGRVEQACRGKPPIHSHLTPRQQGRSRTLPHCRFPAMPAVSWIVAEQLAATLAVRQVAPVRLVLAQRRANRRSRRG